MAYTGCSVETDQCDMVLSGLPDGLITFCLLHGVALHPTFAGSVIIPENDLYQVTCLEHVRYFL